MTELSETEFQRELIKRAKQAGWIVAHVEKAQRRPGKWTTPTTAGLPDLILLRPPQLVFLELKRQTAHPTPAQLEWIVGLQGVDAVEAFIVRPSDADEILALLARPRPVTPPPANLQPPEHEETTAP